MALTLAQILALPTQTRPRLIKASDRGGAIYQIEEGAAGSTATPVIPNNNDARAVIGLGNTDPVAFGEVGIGNVGDLRLVRTDAGEVSLLNGDSNLNGRLRIQNLTVSTGVITMGVNTLTVTGASAINQDLRTTASPTWAGGTFTGPISTTQLSASGTATFGVARVNSGSSYQFSTRSQIFSPADGQISFRNNANSADASLLFGGGTSSGPVTITDTTQGLTIGTPPVSQGLISLRQATDTDINGVTIYNAANTAAGRIWMQGSTVRINNGSAGNGLIALNGNGGGRVTIGSTTDNGVDRLQVNGSMSATNATLSGSLTLPRTVIPPGTTGAQTINTATGKVRFAAGASTLVVTNSLATVNSIIFPNLDSADLTAKYAEITPANGSFTIRLNAAATAECTVSFGILTP